MQTQIQQFNKVFTDRWNSLPTSFPDIHSEFLVEEQFYRQQIIDQLVTKVKKADRSSKMTELAIQKSKKSIGNLLQVVFNFSENEIATLVNDDFTNCTFQFIEMAEQFDEQLPKSEIFQAMRNYWIINTLQLLFNRPAEVTPSLFAYSMLYPYSDNLLDDEQISKADKTEFCQKFGKWLHGEYVAPVSYTETKVFELVKMIEQEWDRIQYPEIYESLIAIHDAQFKSIRLQNDTDSIQDEMLLEICFEKGGTSVLADGYLILGEMNESQKIFCYGFGIYLQLIDDFQDVDEDLKSNICTYLNSNVNNNKLEAMVNKSFFFLEQVLNDIDGNSKHAEQIQSVIRKSVQFMIFDFIADHQHYFNTNYIQQLKLKSTVSFDYLKSRKSKSNEQKQSFMAQIDKAYRSRKLSSEMKRYA